MKPKIITLPPNRVRRNYLGGKMLDSLVNHPNPSDSNRPEDWIASTVEARNPGQEMIKDEGLAYAIINNENVLLKDLFLKDPIYYLGKNHFKALQNNLGFLAKLLDSSMRLHLQAHPTAEFAQKHLGSKWGKLETYTILDIRDNAEGYIWLGFQKAPNLEEWTRIVLEQDLDAMHHCFEKVPVKAGQVWVIPGGMPHAIGEGVFVLEVMEPTDLVVRCEFEREGITVPPEARFMNMEPKDSLKIFDFTEYSVSAVEDKCKINPKILHKDKLNNTTELLIGPKQTDCFNIRRMRTKSSYQLNKEEIIYIGIVAKGQGSIIVDGENTKLVEGDTFILPAAQLDFTLKALATSSLDSPLLEVVFCTPGYNLEKI